MPDHSVKSNLIWFGVGLLVASVITYLVMRNPVDYGELDMLKTELQDLEQQKAQSDSLVVILKRNVEEASTHKTPDQHINNAQDNLRRLRPSVLLDSLRSIYLKRPE